MMKLHHYLIIANLKVIVDEMNHLYNNLAGDHVLSGISMQWQYCSIKLLMLANT